MSGQKPASSNNLGVNLIDREIREPLTAEHLSVSDTMRDTDPNDDSHLRMSTQHERALALKPKMQLLRVIF